MTTPPEVWLRGPIDGVAPAIGFHLAHLPGSLDRLLTYSRGTPVSEAQRAALEAVGRE